MQVTAGTDSAGEAAHKSTRALIVINVDIAGNGRAGALSAQRQEMNPHQFLRCWLFPVETGAAGP